VIVDYHMHLRAPDESIDHSVEAVERFVKVAAARGLDEIGFTEHVYYFAETRSLWSVPYHVERCHYPLESYVDAVVEAKRQGMPVKLGLEVDYVPGREEDTCEILAPYPWDYLVGSIHRRGRHRRGAEPGRARWSGRRVAKLLRVPRPCSTERALRHPRPSRPREDVRRRDSLGLGNRRGLA
jgi:histidinol-phosphatase (PHP family)